MLIQIASIHQLSMWFRQTPGGDGVWEDVRYTFEDVGAEADWLVVYDEAPPGFVARVPHDRRILFLSEPRTIKRYPARCLAQFGRALSISEQPGYQGRIFHGNPALPWFYGLDINNPKGPQNYLHWDALEAADKTDRPERGEISVVCSTKTMNLNQHRRLRFLHMLKDRLGERLTIFGRGFQPIEDKAEGIDGFRYHLVLENNLLEHGWTEKLADPIIGGAFPIVSGGALESYFDPVGYRSIDTTRPREAVDTVERILDEDPAANARDAMAENKRRLMREHNFFEVCRRIALADPAPSAKAPAEEVLIAPRRSRMDKVFSTPKVLRKPLRRLYLATMERS